MFFPVRQPALSELEPVPLIRRMAKMYNVPVSEALAISNAENGTRQCDRESVPNSNGSIDYGLFQVNSIHLHRFTVEQLKDCIGNVRAAFTIYNEQGNWSAWSAYNNGSYLKYLPLYQ